MIKDKTMEFRVTWETDVDAKSPILAAKEAHEMQLSTKSTATVFKVSNGKQEWEFDIGPVEPVKKPMDLSFALFNSHVNDALDRAKDAFIAMYGEDTWKEQILSKIEGGGIMSIMDDEPEEYTQFFVYSVWLFVNRF